MKVLIGLVLVGCGVGIVGIQAFGDPAGWAQTVPADLSKLGLAAIAILALTVGGMVLTPGTAAAATPDAPPAVPQSTSSKRLKLDESEVAEVLSLDEDEEAARRRARRAARRRKKAREAAALESGEAPRKKTKTRTRTKKKAKHVRSYSDEDVQPRPRPRKRSSQERTRKRKREHATSGRN